MIGLPLVLLIAARNSAAPQELAVPTKIPEEADRAEQVWLSDVGRGFRKNSYSIEVKLSRAFGTTKMGSDTRHDLTLAQVQAGLILADVMEPDHWFGGNLEGLGILMAGAQDEPHAAYLVALNGGLRYHFRTGTPVVPFIGGTFGVALSDIGDPDATGKFQFNESIGGGIRYFFDPTTALTFDYALWHVSNGGIKQPNNGVTAHVVSFGLAWLF